MSSEFGKLLKISVFGQSHGKAIGVNIDGLPAGEAIDLEALNAFRARRKPGKSPLSTTRKVKIQNMKVMPVLDIASLGFLIGQGIGRWGNFANQEAFGTPTDLPWGMISENTGGVTVHPCFLYESIWCLLGFVIIHFLSKKFQKYSGQVFYMYLVWYGFERMLVEGLRTDSLYLPFTMFGAEIRVSQLLSLLLVIFGVVMLIINRKKEDPFYADYRRKKSVG